MTEQETRNEAIRAHEAKLDELIQLAQRLVELKREHQEAKARAATTEEEISRLINLLLVTRTDLMSLEQKKWAILIRQDHTVKR